MAIDYTELTKDAPTLSLMIMIGFLMRFRKIRMRSFMKEYFKALIFSSSDCH